MTTETDHVMRVPEDRDDDELDQALLIQRRAIASSRDQTCGTNDGDSDSSCSIGVEHVACARDGKKLTLEDVKSPLYAPGVFLQPSHSRTSRHTSQ